MVAYYNENDPYAAQWLRNLIAEGLIPAGDVDDRSIADVQPDDLKGYIQCHFFAGIGGWPLALQHAGWDATRPVWTGSCPCQPFSGAGRRKGTADSRHLWPEFRRLIEAAKPPTVFGEQVASKDGRLWLAGVRSDMEGMAYDFGAADLCAAGVGAPHIRQRLYWVAKSQSEQSHGCGDSWRGWRELADGSPARRLADAYGGFPGDGDLQRSGQHGFWQKDAISVLCADGRPRRIPAEPSLQPLAYGVSGRVGQLRAYGNAIVPQVAAEFILAAA